MIHKLLIILLLSGLISCGKNPIMEKAIDKNAPTQVKAKHESSDPKLAIYNDIFENYSILYTENHEIIPADLVPINFNSEYFASLSTTSSSSQVIATCLIYPNDDMEVLVNPSVWVNLNSSQKEMVILHELGHCILGIGHVDSNKELMFYTLIDYNYYLSHKNIILHNFFSFY